MLAKVVATNHRDWDDHLPAVLAAYGASKHEATGYTPNFLVFGRENRAPLDLVLGVVMEEQEHHIRYNNYVSEFQQRQRNAYELAEPISRSQHNAGKTDMTFVSAPWSSASDSGSGTFTLAGMPPDRQNGREITISHFSLCGAYHQLTTSFRNPVVLALK